MNKTLVVCAWLTCVSLTISAQVSSLMDQDQRGVVLAAGVQAGKDFNGYTCNLGWAINGRFDIEANIMHTSFNTDNQYTYDGVSNELEGLVTWWMIRQPLNRSLTLDLGLKAGLEKNHYDMYSYWTKDSEGNNDKFYTYNGCMGGKLGLDLVMSCWLTEQLFIQPFATCFGELGESYQQNEGGIDETISFTRITGRIGLALVKQLPDNSACFIKPNILLNTLNLPVCYNLTAGYIITF
ncbi:MAG: hypothetical protein Q8914_00155 [Bacteroidota bacterium]|nr:hypothetical protein [Bacteroidota bacterium]